MQPQQSRKHGHLYATSMSHPLSYVPLFMRRCIAVGITLGLSAFDSAGWQQNRKVELLVSGEAIAKPVNPTTESLR
jgi:hypothetical protein